MILILKKLIEKNKDGYLDFFLIFIVLSIGAFLRFFLIREIPCGLFPDQAIHGLDAIRFADGFLSPIYSRQEGLIVYLIALSHFLFGRGIWQIFIVSAFIGTATIATTYLAVKEVFNRQAALLSSLILAISGWHIALSRNGFRAILVPLAITLLIFFLAKSIKSKSEKQKRLHYMLTAAVFALGFYTYNAFVIFAFTIFFILLFYIIKNWNKSISFGKANKKLLITSVATFAVVIFPIALYVVMFPEKYFLRAGEVSIFAQSKSIWEAILIFLKNFLATFQGIFHIGDLNWRHNPTGEPLLNPLLAPFFFLTLLYAIYKRGKYLILVILFLMMMLPALLTNEGIPPHGLRLIGIIPILFIFPAISLAWLLKAKKKSLKVTSYIIIAIMMTFIAVHEYKNYFYGANSGHYYFDYRCDLTSVSEYAKQNKPVTIITDAFSHNTLRYLLNEDGIKYVMTEDFLQTDKNFNPNKIILVSSFGEFDQEILKFLKENFKTEVKDNKFGDKNFYIFTR